MSGALRVHLLGRLAVDGFAEHELGSRKGRRLLKALAVAEGKPVGVDRLIDLLWPDAPPKQPADQLGVLVSRLRGTLGAERIERSDAGYSLAIDWLDIAELSQRTDQAVAALADGRLAAARAAAQAALSLAGGELLPGEEGDWVEAVRAHMASVVATARRIAVDAAARAGDPTTVIRDAEVALVHDPYDESMVRALMRAHADAGRTGSALAVYARLRERLVEDLGVSPGPEVDELHALILRGEVSGAEVTTPPMGELVGRGAELAVLDAALESIRTGRSQTIVVEGQSGIGKTALVRTWLGRATTCDIALFESRCDELGRDLPLQPIADALAVAYESAGEEVSRIEERDLAILAEALGIGPSTVRARDPADAEPLLTRLYAAILRAMEALAGRLPIVVFVDDLHLAGRSTQEWLGFAVRRSARVLVVGTRRNVGATSLADEVLVSLGPLAVDAVAELVGADRADEFHRRSGGNPLLLSALLDVTSGDLPGTLHDAVQRQLAGLGPGQESVRIAAVLGQQLDLDVLSAVLRRPAVDVLADLERAGAAGLLVEEGAGFAFRHELIRETFVADVSSARQALVHRDAARILAERDADSASIAHHARLGGDRRLAAEAFRQAAAAAELRHDAEAAEAYLDASLDMVPEVESLVARARVRMSVLRLDGAADDAAAAIDAGGGAEALEIAAWVAYYSRRYDEAVAYADEAAAAATDSAARIGALAVGGRVRHGRGDLPAALDLLGGIDDGPQRVRAVAHVWHAHALVHAGEPSDALRVVEHALAVGDQMAQPFAPLHGRFARTMALGHLGRLDDASTSAEDLSAVLERFGAIGDRFIGPTWNLRAWTRRIVGRHAEADEANHEALRATSGHAGPSSPSMAEAYWVALLDLTDGALIAGDADSAGELLALLDGMNTWTGTMAWHQRHRLDLLRARAALLVDDDVTALELSLTVARDAGSRRAGRYAAIAQAVALAAGANGDIDEVCGGLTVSAGAESWWLMALIADRNDSDTLRARAGAQAARLLDSAGPHATTMGAWISRTLG